MNDLVSRLRGSVWAEVDDNLMLEAADRLKETIWMQGEISRLRAENEQMREALLDSLSSLVAAHSLLSSGGKKGAPSDKIFALMLSDYSASITRARATLAETAQESE